MRRFVGDLATLLAALYVMLCVLYCAWATLSGQGRPLVAAGAMLTGAWGACGFRSARPRKQPPPCPSQTPHSDGRRVHPRSLDVGSGIAKF